MDIEIKPWNTEIASCQETQNTTPRQSTQKPKPLYELAPSIITWQQELMIWMPGQVVELPYLP